MCDNIGTMDYRIRDIPIPVHRRIKAIAAMQGKTINAAIIIAIEKYVEAEEKKLK